MPAGLQSSCFRPRVALSRRLPGPGWKACSAGPASCCRGPATAPRSGSHSVRVLLRTEGNSCALYIPTCMKLPTIEPSPSHLSPITGSHTAGDTKGILSARAAAGERDVCGYALPAPQSLGKHGLRAHVHDLASPTLSSGHPGCPPHSPQTAVTGSRDLQPTLTQFVCSLLAPHRCQVRGEGVSSP